MEVRVCNAEYTIRVSDAGTKLCQMAYFPKKETGMKIQTVCNPININYQYQTPMRTRESADPAVVLYKDEYFLIREIIVFDKYTSISIAPYRRVLTQVRAFLFVTGKRPCRRIFRTRMS